ncbi:hypothetical protein [Altererythrobacter sp. Z27]|uniref:hypothetical protein n=1 Tax=Altererythrobacter sp. Z27 TaxID=3461147 RepID=UPI0040442931
MRLFTRGEGLSELAEIWIEDAFLVELFDAVQLAGFQSRVDRTAWRELVGTA